jgi:DNA-binding HxlR family transcriptional regulator
MWGRTTDLEDYLCKTGSVELLYALAEGEMSFVELKYRVMVSPSTLSARLREGIMLRLIEQVPMQGSFDSLRMHVRYRLTDWGREIVRRLEKIKDEFLRIRKEIEDLKFKLNKKKRDLTVLIHSLELGDLDKRLG